jgi:hypothetical protein
MQEALEQKGQKAKKEGKMKETHPRTVPEDYALGQDFPCARKKARRVRDPQLPPLGPDVPQAPCPEDISKGTHTTKENQRHQKRLNPSHLHPS